MQKRHISTHIRKPLPQKQTEISPKISFLFQKNMREKKRRRTESNEKRSRMKGLDQKVLCVPVLAQREREREERQSVSIRTRRVSRADGTRE